MTAIFAEIHFGDFILLRFSLLLLTLITTCSVSAETACDVVPEGMTGRSVAGKALKWTGDFNRDKITDQMEIVSVAPAFKKSIDIVIANPWDRRAGEIASKGETVGFLITHGKNNGNCKRFFLVAQSYFSGPTWSAFLKGEDDSAPIELVKTGSSKFKQWKRDLPSLQGDAFELVSEAGIDILLYWSKGRYEVMWTNEEP